MNVRKYIQEELFASSFDGSKFIQSEGFLVGNCIKTNLEGTIETWRPCDALWEAIFDRLNLDRFPKIKKFIRQIYLNPKVLTTIHYNAADYEHKPNIVGFSVVLGELNSKRRESSYFEFEVDTFRGNSVKITLPAETRSAGISLLYIGKVLSGLHCCSRISYTSDGRECFSIDSIQELENEIKV